MEDGPDRTDGRYLAQQRAQRQLVAGADLSSISVRTASSIGARSMVGRLRRRRHLIARAASHHGSHLSRTAHCDPRTVFSRRPPALVSSPATRAAGGPTPRKRLGGIFRFPAAARSDFESSSSADIETKGRRGKRKRAWRGVPVAAADQSGPSRPRKTDSGASHIVWRAARGSSDSWNVSSARSAVSNEHIQTRLGATGSALTRRRAKKLTHPPSRCRKVGRRAASYQTATSKRHALSLIYVSAQHNA